MPDFLASDDVRLHVEIAGPDAAPTVVLVHGLAASVELGWRATGVLDRLGAAGLRTVAYDSRAHGKSDAPHEPGKYGDERAAADLSEIVGTCAGPEAILAGYSMGSATILVALSGGLVVRGATLGATPAAVLTWSDDDQSQLTTAVAVLEGLEPPAPTMQWWIQFLDATGVDKVALAALLRRHRPVVRDWAVIGARIVVAAGVDDTAAAPSSELLARLPDASSIELAGDHVSAAASPAFTDAIAGLARAVA